MSETFYKVRRGGTRRPVGSLLTTAEFESIKNHKQLLASGHFVAVIKSTPKAKEGQRR